MQTQTVVVAQLVRALDCGSRGRRFETGLPPIKKKPFISKGFFFYDIFCFPPRKKIQIQDLPQRCHFLKYQEPQGFQQLLLQLMMDRYCQLP